MIEEFDPHFHSKSPRGFRNVNARGPLLQLLTSFAIILTATAVLPANDRSSEFDGKAARQTRTDNSAKITLIWCPAGEFKMGTAGAKAPTSAPGSIDAIGNEKPVKIVFSQGFWIGKSEITRGQWSAIMDSTPWNEDLFQKNLPKQENPNYPATFLDWNQATQFCDKLTSLERGAGRLPIDWRYSLPAEAEWEYACRAGTTTAFSFGDDEILFENYGWFVGNSRGLGDRYPHPVGLLKPNPWGLHDMHGNVSEWCIDQDKTGSKHSGIIRPTFNPTAKYRVIRGGSYDSQANACRSANREGGAKPNTRISTTGFRVVIVPKPN